MSNRDKLNRFCSLFTGTSKVLVVINADPDAIASAMAVKRLLWRKVREVAIAHFNKISRPDNLAMIEYTEPGLIALDDIRKEDFNAFVVVDSQPDHNERFLGFDYDAITDHHPLTCDNAMFADIRPDYGACSTIMTEYLKSKKTKPSSRLAAALMLGIKTDTSDFTRNASLRDIRAFQYLYKNRIAFGAGSTMQACSALTGISRLFKRDGVEKCTMIQGCIMVQVYFIR